MPIRNPFVRRPETFISNDENIRPAPQETKHAGFERVDTFGSKASSALSIRSSKSHDTGEYKMSVVNDSGVYLPPSPTEEKSQHWPMRHFSSRASTDTQSSHGDIEHFSISRESFDSYRRSFDITARAPVKYNDTTVRQNLDTARFPLQQRPIQRKMEQQPPTPEESFEDIVLDDVKQQPRKRGFFAKLTDMQDKDSAMQAMPRFLMTGRNKRALSGQGAELGSVGHGRAPVTDEVH